MSEKCILDPERDCLGLIKARELEQDVNELRKQNSATHERLFDKIGEIEKHEGIQGIQYENIIEKLGNLSDSVAGLREDSKEVASSMYPLTSRVETLEKNAENIGEFIEELKEKPAKRIDGIVEKIIGMVVGAVMGYILVKLGLSM